MPSSDMIEAPGVVKEQIRGGKFIVECTFFETQVVDVTCTLSGKLKVNHIRVLKGDNVTVEVSPYNLKSGRITWRFK